MVKRAVLRFITGFALCGVSAWADAAQFVRAPGVPQVIRPGELAGLLLQNTDTSPIGPSVVTFGTMFADHALPRGDAISATVDKQAEIAQADVKTRYADGSAQYAVITLSTPHLGGSADAKVMLRRTARPLPSHSPSISSALKQHNVTVQIHILQGHYAGQYRFDLARMYAEARRKGAVSPWRSGRLAHEVRVQDHVASSLRLVVDLTAYRGGSLGADIQFDNDIAMSKSGGALVYSVSIFLNKGRVYHLKKIKEFQYQDWHLILRSGGRVPVNIVHNIARLEKMGAFHYYNLKVGVLKSILEGEYRKIHSRHWDKPLSPNGVTQYMPMTGGRGDIGPTTLGNAAWLISQNPVAAAYALGQADAAGAVPWHFYYDKTKTYLTTADFPNLWVDVRGGKHSGTTGLTQQVSAKTGWHADVAHEPDLSYVPYVLTGKRYFLDQLNSEADFSIADQWPPPRAGGRGIIVGSGEQVRGAAWSLREVAEAAYIDPDKSELKKYFNIIVKNNIIYLKSHLPTWTREEGDVYGYVAGDYGFGSAMMPPWQQDFFGTTIAMMARHNLPEARRVALWQLHFLAKSVLAPGTGFQRHNGIAYNLKVYDPRTHYRYKTWAEVQRGTATAGQSNGNGWSHSRGYYGQTRMAALAAIFNATGSLSALKAYHWVSKSGAPDTGIVDRARSCQYWIVPAVHIWRSP